MSLDLLIAGAVLLSPTVATGSRIEFKAEPRQIVLGFLNEVRSGRHPDAAKLYFAPSVQAHQVTAEGEATITRTPDEYAAHVRDFLRLFGDYDFKVVECLGEGDRVYVRWRQTGHHSASFDGEAPTGRKLTEISSAVYRVEDGKIVEYWIQSDRKGLELQLQAAAAADITKSEDTPSTARK